MFVNYQNSTPSKINATENWDYHKNQGRGNKVFLSVIQFFFKIYWFHDLFLYLVLGRKKNLKNYFN